MKQQIKEDKIEQITGLFKILGDTTRLKIIWMLDSEICVSELAKKLEMEQSAVSHQLSILKAGGLVDKRRDGKQVYYKLADNNVKQVLKVGMENAGKR